MFELVTLQEQDEQEILQFLGYNQAGGDERSVEILTQILAERQREVA